jgi:hypothetical protein
MMIELDIDTPLLRIGGYYLNEVDIVRYKGIFDEPGYHRSVMVEEDCEWGPNQVSHTPQPRHLFTFDGIDIYTEEITTNNLILDRL